MRIETYGALFRRGARHDRGDQIPELEKIQTRRRMRIGLEAADAFEQAVREGAVFVTYAGADDECDPVDMAVEFMVIDGTGDDRVNPTFRFSLREAFLNPLKDTDWSVANHYRAVADGLEALLVEMRAELAMFSLAEAEDRADRERPPE